MHRNALKTLTVTGAVALGLALAPAASSAAAEPVHPAGFSIGHVNSNVDHTNVYDNYSGANAVGVLYRCNNFYYSGYYNGRYHISGGTYDGRWVSTSTTSPGSASSGVGCNP